MSGLTWDDLSDSGRWLYQVLTRDGSNLSGNDGAAGGSSGNGSSNVVAKSGDIEATATLANSWESNGQKFYQYTLTIKNTSSQACQSWAVDVKFNGDISLSDGWNGQYSAEGDTLHISSVDYNGKLDAGGSTGDVGFIISGKAGLEIQ